VIDASVARRYARALLSLGLEEGRHEQYGEELESAVGALAESREAASILENPGYGGQQRQATIDTFATSLKLSPVMVSFLRLLVDRRRISGLPAIARAYRHMVDEKIGRVRATVTSAAPLSKDETERLRETLAEMTGRTIILDTKTDPAIVGGIVAQVGATMYDGSLRTQLERLRQDLKRGPL
jgi:F-type H+-transporting ATPase subunit delta